MWRHHTCAIRNYNNTMWCQHITVDILSHNYDIKSQNYATIKIMSLIWHNKWILWHINLSVSIISSFYVIIDLELASIRIWCVLSQFKTEQKSVNHSFTCKNQLKWNFSQYVKQNSSVKSWFHQKLTNYSRWKWHQLVPQRREMSTFMSLY